MITLKSSGSPRRRQLPLAVVPLVTVAVVPVTTALLVWLAGRVADVLLLLFIAILVAVLRRTRAPRP